MPTLWYQDPLAVATTFATFVIAVATVVGIIISAKIMRVTREHTQATKEYTQTSKESIQLTRDIFEAAHRPYIGVVDIKRRILTLAPRMAIEIAVKNAGSVPAVDFKSLISVFVDGQGLSAPLSKDEPISLLLPDETRLAKFSPDNPRDHQSLINATDLTVHFSCSYKGATQKEYCYEQMAKLDADGKSFNVLWTRTTCPPQT